MTRNWYLRISTVSVPTPACFSACFVYLIGIIFANRVDREFRTCFACSISRFLIRPQAASSTLGEPVGCKGDGVINHKSTNQPINKPIAGGKAADQSQQQQPWELSAEVLRAAFRVHADPGNKRLVRTCDADDETAPACAIEPAHEYRLPECGCLSLGYILQRFCFSTWLRLISRSIKLGVCCLVENPERTHALPQKTTCAFFFQSHWRNACARLCAIGYGTINRVEPALFSTILQLT